MNEQSDSRLKRFALRNRERFRACYLPWRRQLRADRIAGRFDAGAQPGGVTARESGARAVILGVLQSGSAVDQKLAGAFQSLSFREGEVNRDVSFYLNALNPLVQNCEPPRTRPSRPSAAPSTTSRIWLSCHNWTGPRYRRSTFDRVGADDDAGPDAPSATSSKSRRPASLLPPLTDDIERVAHATPHRRLLGRALPPTISPREFVTFGFDLVHPN